MGISAKKEILGKGKYLQLCQEERWEWVERINCSGVVIMIAMTAGKKVLLVEQYRIPCRKNVIEFPAGLVGDHGEKESLETAARRELLEETGYAAEHFKLLTEGPPSAGLSTEILSFFLAEGLEKKGDGGGDHHESIIVHEVPVKEVEGWLKLQEKQGKLVDPKVYAGLYFLSK